eukprot:6192810-Pleurochrysis_carterae.AAC.6
MAMPDYACIKLALCLFRMRLHSETLYKALVLFAIRRHNEEMDGDAWIALEYDGVGDDAFKVLTEALTINQTLRDMGLAVHKTRVHGVHAGCVEFCVEGCNALAVRLEKSINKLTTLSQISVSKLRAAATIPFCGLACTCRAVVVRSKSAGSTSSGALL